MLAGVVSLLLLVAFQQSSRKFTWFQQEKRYQNGGLSIVRIDELEGCATAWSWWTCCFSVSSRGILMVEFPWNADFFEVYSLRWGHNCQEAFEAVCSRLDSWVQRPVQLEWGFLSENNDSCDSHKPCKVLCLFLPGVAVLGLMCTYAINKLKQVTKWGTVTRIWMCSFRVYMQNP